MNKIERCKKCGIELLGCTWDEKSAREHQEIERKIGLKPLCEMCVYKLKSKNGEKQ